MSKHTPGPWCDETGPLLGADGRQVGEPEPGIDLMAQLDRMRADRALIRAAPDMLTALRTIALHAPSLDVTGIRELCDAAIAKAGGRA